MQIFGGKPFLLLAFMGRGYFLDSCLSERKFMVGVWRWAMFEWLRHRAMHQRVRGDAQAIKDFLLQVLEDNRNGVEKFSDEALERAAAIIEQVGPGAFYWMTDIAAQMVVLSEATLRGFSTNVSVELGANADAESIVNLVVRLP
jgi:hypothetical protein